MNMLLLEPGESGVLLPREDRRWEHLAKILRKKPGDTVLAGSTDGWTGTATIERLDAGGLTLVFRPEEEAPPLHPICLILGFPRPIQAARIFKDLGSLGVGEIILTGTELGEKSYIQSDFFSQCEYRRSLAEGAEQAGSPRLPRVSRYWTLDRCLGSLGARKPDEASRFFFHPDRTLLPFSRILLDRCRVTGPILAIGSERGWTDKERMALLEAGFQPTSLGTRILKTETAALAAVVLALGAMGAM